MNLENYTTMRGSTDKGVILENFNPKTLRIGQRYHRTRLNPPYDAIVIGSGITGLSTAAMLAELGWKVAVFEKHYTAGGCTHSYTRKATSGMLGSNTSAKWEHPPSKLLWKIRAAMKQAVPFTP